MRNICELTVILKLSLTASKVLINLFFMATNKLFYIANARLPTEKAHGMQIMKSCEAFARAGIEVELIVPRRRNPMAADPFEYYKVERSFTIRTAPTFDTVRFGRLGFLIELFSFLVAARAYLLWKRCFVYTREEWVGLFFGRFALETHAVPHQSGFLRRYISRKARVHFVLTSFIKTELIRQGVTENRIAIAPDAVDLLQFDIPLSKASAREKRS